MKHLFWISALVVSWSVTSCDKSTTCVENIDPDCICPAHYDPVCGCNNKTYGNSCVASCAGITDYQLGECP